MQKMKAIFHSDAGPRLAARFAALRAIIGPAVMRRLRGWVLSNRSRLGQLWTAAAQGSPIGRVEE